jgi:hypothetical protein
VRFELVEKSETGQTFLLKIQVLKGKFTLQLFQGAEPLILIFGIKEGRDIWICLEETKIRQYL